MKELLEKFLLQVQFFTRIPVPRNIKFDEKKFAAGVMFAPLVGLIIGFILGCTYSLVNITGQLLPAVVTVVAVEIIITGGLHLDGLADTFDGIFSNRPREKILQIMKDSRIGTNGALSLILIIIAKIGFLFSLNNGYLLEYLFLMPVISRMNVVWTAGISSYARKEGMAGAVIRYTEYREIIISTAIAAVLSAVFLKMATLIVIPVSIFFVYVFTKYVQKKIRGITGDSIGAVIELTEIVFLFALLIYEAVFVA